MSNTCIKDNALIASYFDGRCTEAERELIQRKLETSPEFREHLSQLGFLLTHLDESKAEQTNVPSSVTQRALDLFEDVATQSSLLSIAVSFVDGLLQPLKDGLQPQTPAQVGLRGHAVEDDELAYHVTLGSFSLTVELNGLNAHELELWVRPRRPVPPGWTIRLKEGDHTRTVSSFDEDGLQVDALGRGIYTVSLEHKEETEHQFHLRLVSDDDSP